MLRSFRFGLCCLLLLPFLLTSQEFRASVTGHVTDPSGAVIPNVKVQITELSTNANALASSNMQGVYSLPALNPGTYRLTAEAPGFKKFIRDQIVLNVGDVAGIDIVMEVGSAGESVTVSAQSVTLQTENADRGLVMDQTRVLELPISARNPFMLAMLSTAVQWNGGAQYQRPFDGVDVSISGSRNDSSEWLLDGAPNTQSQGYQTPAMIPPVDSVEEFKIQTNSYDASFGKSSGGIVNVFTKSGTNHYHGTGYEFMRRAAWDANTFANNATGAPYTAHFLDQWGGSIGGPIVIPKVYDGRNKSFFFFNLEPYREGTPTPLTLSVPQPEMLNGDFSKLVDSQGRKITIYDPTSATLNADGSVTRQPFTNNMIPATMINPIMKKVMGYFPAPSQTAAAGQTYGANDLFIPGGKDNLDHDSFYNLIIKLDQIVATKHHLFFRHGSNDRTEERNTNGVLGLGWTGPDPLKRINDAYVLDWVGSLTPTLVVGARVAFSRYKQATFDSHNYPFDMSTLGFPQSLASQFQRQQLGTYVFSGLNTLGQDYGNSSVSNTRAAAFSVSKSIGKHTIKGGLDLRWIGYNVVNVGTGIDMTFDPTWTQKTYNLADSLSGNSWASALLGFPASGYGTRTISPATLNPYYALYVQDDVKLTRKITVNLGLRYDIWPGSSERYSRLARGFDPSATNPVNAAIDRTTQFANFPTVKGGLLYTASGQSPFNYFGNTWQPRLGVAYQISDKLVMRAGFGRYIMGWNNEWIRTEGYTVTTGLVNSLDNGKTPISNVMTSPFPSGLIQPPGKSLGLGTLLGQNISFFEPTAKIPSVNQFSFGFQYQLPAQSTVDVSYAGSRSYDLQDGCPYYGSCTGNTGYNLPPVSTRKLCNPMDGGTPSYCDALQPNPFYNVPLLAGTTIGKSPTLSRYALAAPFPEFGNISQFGVNHGKIWYNAASITYGIRAKKGLSLTFAYTLSKQIQQLGFIDPVAQVLERGVSAIDRTHVVKISGVYELPFGRGKALLSGVGRVADAFVGGWQYNIIYTFQSGLPWATPAGTIQVRNAAVPINWHQALVTGVRACVAQVNDDGSVSMMPYSATVAGCDLTNYSFLRLPRYAPSVGPLRSPTIRLRSQSMFDMSLSKTVKFTETVRFQYRLEAFDAFNSYCNWGQNFVNTVTSSSFGTLAPAQLSGPIPNRQVQMGFKFIF